MSEAVNTFAEGSSSAGLLDDLWSEVVGQPQLVEELRMAAVDPVQAYLLVGPAGAGKRAAATAFAAELVSAGLDEPEAQRAVSLASAQIHPSIHIVEREGQSIAIDVARGVVRAASRAPAEGHVQVFILEEFHLVSEAAPTLLKAIEEPEAGTVFVVLAEEVTEGLVTIASRCVQYQVPRVPIDVLQVRLEAEGFGSEASSEAARSADGSLRQARLLASDPELVARRAAWRGVPLRLDGTGATVAVLCDELLDSVEDVLAPLLATQAQEVEAFEEMMELTGGSAKGRRDAMEARHKREARRLRTSELVAGSVALMGQYRDSAIDGGSEAIEQFEASAGVAGEFVTAINSNANERLALSAMLLGLDQQ